MRRSLLFSAVLILTAFTGRNASAGREEVERYKPSFRLAVKESIERGVERLKSLQLVSGLWADTGDQMLGHSALPTLALLKAGVPVDDPVIRSAFRAMAKLRFEETYSVACYLMAVHAKYQPKLDTFVTDVGTLRAKRLKPAEVRAKLSDDDVTALERGTKFLSDAQRVNGFWHYRLPKRKGQAMFDLSNTQYALLGLRAAADCGIEVKSAVWNEALRALIAHQDTDGEKVQLLVRELRDNYIIEYKEKAKARPFRYRPGMKDGPKGKKTVPLRPATGSMTCAGVACVGICVEGLWRSRAFRGRDRKKAKVAIRDGLAWIQEHFTVTENPGHPRKVHHMYYLYGLERMGMLTGHRFIAKHDWYKEGADHLLETQQEDGGWGKTPPTCFAILFLKRATAPAITGE